MMVTMGCVGRRIRALMRWRSAAALLALGALGACGGGGERASQFLPTALTVFGDEANVIGTGAAGNGIPEGYRYTVNGFTTSTTTDTPPVTTSTFNCLVNPIWVQQLASFYGFGLPGCPLTADTAKASRNFAAAGSGVAALAAQVDAALAQRAFTRTDLVTVYTGQNDLIALYEALSVDATITDKNAACKYDVGSAGSAGAVARQAVLLGDAVADQVNRIAANGNGGRVLFLTVPSLEISPLGVAENARPDTGFDRAACLGNLSSAFNSGLRTEVVQDGRLVGLVQVDEQVLSAVKGLIGYSDVTSAVCGVDLPACTTATLATLTPAVTTDNYAAYLWADDRRFSVNMHSRVGSLAITRAYNNPF
jgi:hypothetical protein